jgi:hypothetical protein
MPSARRRDVEEAFKSIPGLRAFFRSAYAPRAWALARDPWNRIRFGPDAPRFAERLWIDPLAVEHFDRRGLSWNSGSVVTGEWSGATQRPIESDPILASSIAHWVDGVPWEETGEIERIERAMQRKRKGQLRPWTSREDVLRRYRELDEAFLSIQREGRVRTQGEVEPGAFRELGGIGMHIGPGGVPIRAGNGRHRFAIARILRIPRIPVRVGLVHRSAIALLPDLRKAPPGEPG